MKRRIFTVLTVFFLIAVTLIAPLFITAAEEESEIDANTAAQLDYTDTYYYDRISERQQWCYNWLKNYYDNFTGEPGRQRYDFTDMLPEGSTEDDYTRLGEDFLISEMALCADAPFYEMEGRFSAFGCYTTGETSGVPGKIAFFVEFTHNDLLTNDTLKQTAARIDQIVDTVGDGDRYTKLRKLTHYLLSNTFYDPYLDFINGSGHDDYALATRGHHYNQSSYGLF